MLQIEFSSFCYLFLLKHPASHTHRQMTDEQLEAAGVPAGLVRISCGLEDKADLIADLKQALEAID